MSAPPSSFFTADATSLLNAVDPNTRLTAKTFAVGGETTDADAKDIFVLRANCVVSATPAQFVLTPDTLTEANIEVEYQTGISTWSKVTIPITATKTQTIPAAFLTFLRNASSGKTASIRYVTSTGINAVTPVNTPAFWQRELEISRSRTTTFSVTGAPVVLGTKLLLSSQAEFYIDQASIILPPGVTLSQWSLKSRGLLSSILTTVSLTVDTTPIPNYNGTGKTAIKFSGTNTLFTVLTSLTLWGEYTQRAVVTGANASFLTPVVTKTDSVTGIRLSLVLGAALSGTRLLVNIDSDAATEVDTSKPGDPTPTLLALTAVP